MKRHIRKAIPMRNLPHWAKNARRFVAVGLLQGVQACTLIGPSPGTESPRPQIGSVDSPEGVATGPEGIEHIPDAVPRQEDKTRSGNPGKYTQFGVEYRVLPTSDGYDREGIASWYGPGFDGQRTSSGDIYDQNAMTAAHTILPLPTYVEVTNLENGRKVVVRVNDRGPFHDERIIDLSYVAALKLGIVQAGTARVRVRALDPPARDRRK